MENKVVSLVPAAEQVKKEYHGAAIEVANELAAAVSAGAITAVVAVTIEEDGTLRMWQGGENRTTELLGAIEALKMHFYQTNT